MVIQCKILYDTGEGFLSYILQLYVTAITQNTRDATTEDLEDKDPNDEKKSDGSQQELFNSLQQVFDRAAEEVYNQLKQSYARFAYTPQFQRVLVNEDPNAKMARQISGSIKNRKTAGGDGETRR